MYQPAKVLMIVELATCKVSIALTGKKIAHIIISETIILAGIATSRAKPS